MGNVRGGNTAKLRYTVEKYQENEPVALKSFLKFPEKSKIFILLQKTSRTCLWGTTYLRNTLYKKILKKFSVKTYKCFLRFSKIIIISEKFL